MKNIGLEKGIVKLVPHDIGWKDDFEYEKKLLLKNFVGKILEVSHGGSTAIPNIPAKPLLDIFAVVASLVIAEEMKTQLSKLGYEYRGEEGVPERIFYAKGDIMKRTVNLHLVERESNEWKNHLLIKNYYLKHPEVALQYAALKQALAEQFTNDRKAYGAGKKDFISRIIQMATKEQLSQS